LNIRVVTNNLKILELTKTINNIESHFLDGDIRDVIFACRDLVMNGWKLVIDPLGGYISRPNPYHTIILSKSHDMGHLSGDIPRLEYLLSKYYRQLDEYENAAKKYKSDYSELDFSLALNALHGLGKFI